MKDCEKGICLLPHTFLLSFTIKVPKYVPELDPLPCTYNGWKMWIENSWQGSTKGIVLRAEKITEARSKAEAYYMREQIQEAFLMFKVGGKKKKMTKKDVEMRQYREKFKKIENLKEGEQWT